MSCRVYIGRLPYQAREKDVERFFRGFGRIRDVNLKNGFGFVEFDDHRDADDAVAELHGRELLGERVIVEPAHGGSRDRDYYRERPDRRRDSYRSSYDSGRSRNQNSRYGPPLRTDYRILVENISSRVSWQDLKDFMRSAGEITYADAHKQRVGDGIVEYATYDDMKNAMKKLNGAELNGRRIRLVDDYRSGKRRSISSSSRSRSRSKSRSRSRSRDRSRSRSRDRSRSRERSRSKDRSRSRDRSRSKSRSRSRDRSRSRSGSRDRSPDRRSESPTRENDRRSDSPRDNEQHNGQDRDSRSRSHSGSRSPVKKDEEMRSRSPSVEATNDVDE